MLPTEGADGEKHERRVGTATGEGDIDDEVMEEEAVDMEVLSNEVEDMVQDEMIADEPLATQESVVEVELIHETVNSSRAGRSSMDKSIIEGNFMTEQLVDPVREAYGQKEQDQGFVTEDED